jgi:signal transduction histidine kinase
MPSWSWPSPDGLLQRFVEASRRGEIVALLNSARSESEMGEVVAAELCEALDAESAFLLVASDGSPPEVIASIGLSPTQRAAVPVDRTCLEALLGAAPALSDDDSLELDAHHVALVPRRVAAGIRLLVGVVRLHDEPFTDGELVLLEAVTKSSAEMIGRLRLTQRLQEAERLEALGRLAGGVAGEFDTLLATIGAQCDLAADGRADPGTVLSEIRLAAANATVLTRNLLSFSRQQAIDPSRLDLNDVVVSCARLLRPLLPAAIQISTVLGPAVSAVHADRAQLEQAIVNLALNARDAMPVGGTLTLETRNIRGEAPAGDYAMLAVADTGAGIHGTVQPRIFEPFFTTKEAAWGLGLASVHGIVGQNGGHVGVDSRPGRGTSIRIYLPAAEAPARGSDGEEPADFAASA